MKYVSGRMASGLPAHVEVVRVPVDARGRLSLPAVLRELTRRDVATLLVEGGPTVAGSFLAEGLVDEVVG